MRRPLLLLFFFLPLPALGFAACATDNGQGVFGDQFGPNDHVDAAGDATPVEGGGPGGDDGGGGDDATADADAAPSCVGGGTVAVLAGGDGSLSGALQIDGAAWTGGAIAGGAATSLPALVAFGAGFLGLTRGASDTLQSVTATTAFGAPTTVVASGVIDSPSLAVVGTSAHAVTRNTNGFYFHGTNAGSGWDAVNDPVVSAAGTDSQSFGQAAAGIAGTGAELVFAQAGNDNGLYVRRWTGSWGLFAGIAGAGAYTTASPALTAVSGSYDVVAVFAEKTSKQIQWTARSAALATQWSLPVAVNALATTTQPLSIAPAGASSLVVAFTGEDGKGYVATGTISGTSITWAAAVPLVAGGVSVDSPPRVAKGVCGDDAIAAFASGGAVKVVRLRAGTWTAPEPVSSVSGSRVAVATK